MTFDIETRPGYKIPVPDREKEMADKVEYLSPDTLIIIGLDTDDRDEHPLFDERVFLPLDENLVKNIMVYGIQQPVLVRREAGRIYVVDGRQRVRAARRAAEMQNSAGEVQVKVPVRETRGEDSRVVGVMVSVNEHRQDDDVLAKAFKASRMLGLVGSLDEVAIAFGRTPTTIKNWMSLVEADPRVHAAVRAGQISPGAAVEVARYDRGKQPEILERLIRAKNREVPVSVNQVQEERRKDGVTASDSPDQAEAAPLPRKDGVKVQQSGIKRTWLRRALGTEAAKGLSAEQKGVLHWLASGESDEDTWWSRFRDAAEAELISKRKQRES